MFWIGLRYRVDLLLHNRNEFWSYSATTPNQNSRLTELRMTLHATWRGHRFMCIGRYEYSWYGYSDNSKQQATSPHLQRDRTDIILDWLHRWPFDEIWNSRIVPIQTMRVSSNIMPYMLIVKFTWLRCSKTKLRLVLEVKSKQDLACTTPKGPKLILPPD